ncbi:HAD family hydrolase [Youngiibacter multivorans]|uniref:Cof subfamily protein (Haloacid dehalogenase superfamily) n=1 Tax=Youngiibacter multivorans TaxID=937251 RepID=A0ABS4G611_9CLOT|nr:HAD family hydrolase [Youngiibacter multivorans]MBP1919892.1 Cof subfamily protein (haloacid dehalogenase superfamily) [Youngiibacter multivorans]
MTRKLICSDLDGTLLTSFKRISDYNISVIRSLQNEGHVFSVCTGRQIRSAAYYASLIGPDADVIASGGNLILSGGTCIHRTFQDQKQLGMIYDIAERYGLIAGFHGIEALYVTKSFQAAVVNAAANLVLPKEIERRVTLQDKNEFLLHSDEYVLSTLMGMDQSKLQSAKEELDQIGSLNIVSPFTGAFDISTREFDKGTAIRMLANHHGISIEDVISFGDGDNDLSMADSSGTLIAMGNAKDSLMLLADAVADTNDHDGVGRKLVEIFGIDEASL